MTLRDKIDSGTFIVTAELGPPQSASGNAVRKKTVHFRRGVDGVNITDNQTAIVRLSSIAAARIVLEEGLEPVIQMTCRDRNRIAIQSDLLGAAALGIENVLTFHVCAAGPAMSRPHDIVGLWAKQDTCLEQSFPVVDGSVAAPVEPGLGISLNMDAVERYAVKGQG